MTNIPKHGNLSENKLKTAPQTAIYMQTHLDFFCKAVIIIDKHEFYRAACYMKIWYKDKQINKGVGR